MNTIRISLSLLLILACAGFVANAEAVEPPKQKTAAAATAKAPAKPKPLVDATTGMEFVLVKGGCYQMGDTFGDGEADQKPVHEVCVADFNLGKYEVTRAQWQKVMGANPATDECGPNCPVTFVSWEMTQEFIRKLNEKSGKQYRLPTEAEWEYAARSGGKNEKWPGVSDNTKLVDFAWFDQNSPESMIRPVGKKKPNGLALYDMGGSAHEWCQDWYDEGYYAVSPKDSPAGPATGKKRVVRGGSFGDSAGNVTTTARGKDSPDVLDASNGFRLLLPAK